MIKFIKNKLLVKKINKALGYKLTNQQIQYIFYGKDTFTGRKQGKTTAYAIRLCLVKNVIIKKDIQKGYYSDGDYTTAYHYWFWVEFENIRTKLIEAGIKVVDVLVDEEKDRYMIRA